jgi:hypothetical protein
VPIHRSSARDIDSLILQLDSPDAVARDTAAARLRVIGARAVGRLLDTASQTASDRTRVAALTTLEGIPDPRSIDLLLGLLNHADPSSAAAAAAALRPLIAGRHETRIIGALTDVAIDETRDARVRTAAVRALGDLDIETLEPLLARLGAGAPQDPALREAVRAHESASRATAGLPDDPSDARRMLARMGARTSIVDLLRLVDALRARESAEAHPIRRREWMTARAVAHQRLADRGTRVALYDLRETLERAEGPLPVEFLSAVEKIGDAECAAAVAAAYAKTTEGGKTDWWTDHLATAFRSIAKRERITKRNAALQRVARKWPTVLELLFAGPASAGQRRTRGTRRKTF